MNCENCKEPIPPEATNVIARAILIPGRPTKLVYFCREKCRQLWRAQIETESSPAGKSTSRSRNARSGVNRGKMSPAAIKKALRPAETTISKSIGNQLTGAGVWHTRTQSGVIKTQHGRMMHLCSKGTPDRFAACGLPIWIEVKRPGEKPTIDQQTVIKDLRDNGALVFVVDDPAAVRVILAGLAKHAVEISVVQKIVSQIQNEIDADIAATRQ